MIADMIAQQGSWLFRWRSYVLLCLAPFGLYSLLSPEPIEVAFGSFADLVWEISCILLAFLGLAIRAISVGHAPDGTSGRNTKSQSRSEKSLIPMNQL